MMVLKLKCFPFLICNSEGFTKKRTITLYGNLSKSAFPLLILSFFTYYSAVSQPTSWLLLRGQAQSSNVSHCVLLLLF